MGSNPKPNPKPDGLVSFTSTPATQRGKRRATHFLQRVGDIDCNIGTCPNSHEEKRQEFKEQTGKKILAHECLFLMKFMAHEIKYFNFHGKSTNTMKFHFAVLSCFYGP